MAGRIGELEVPALHELGVDPLLADEADEVAIAVERLSIELVAQPGAVAAKQLRVAPLEARVDDPAVAGRGAVAELVRLEDGDPGTPADKGAGGAQPGVATADHDDVRLVREPPIAERGQLGHLRAPQDLGPVIGEWVGARWHGRSVDDGRSAEPGGPVRRATGPCRRAGLRPA